MKQHRIAAAFCPGCCARLDAASGVTTDDSPELGDITVCIHCCALLRLAGDDRLELLRGDDRRSALEDPEVRRVMLAAGMVGQRLGGRMMQ